MDAVRQASRMVTRIKVWEAIRAAEVRTMPFGKHKGMLFEDIPSDYLRWFEREADAADTDLRSDVRQELDRRRAEMRGVEYVTRSTVVHLALDGDLPLCGSWWSWRGNETRYTTWPKHGKPCRKGCFR